MFHSPLWTTFMLLTSHVQLHPPLRSPSRVQQDAHSGASAVQVVLFLELLFMTSNKNNFHLEGVCCNFRKQFPKAKGKYELN